MENHEWEVHKENAEPLKKGRRANSAFEKFLSANDKSELDMQRSEFEDRLAKRTLTLTERMDIFVEYYTWLRRTANQGLVQARTVLERCTKEMSATEEDKNDPRLLQIWIEYADVSSESNDIFSYMYTNKIGVKHALFWIAWAFVAEKQGNVKFADQVFVKGQKYQAEPKDLLSKRYHQFQRRMTRKFLNGDETIKSSALQNVADPVANGNASQRRGLAVIADRKSQQQSKTSSAPEKSNSAPFQIFSDTNNNPKPIKEMWNNLGGDEERRKENTDVAQKWSQAAPILPEGGIKKLVAPAFDIFDDSTPSMPAPLPKMTCVYHEDLEDGTINTKLALQDIEAIFSSPQKNSKVSATTAQPAKKMMFSIFSDENARHPDFGNMSAIRANVTESGSMLNALDDLEDIGEFEDIDCLHSSRRVTYKSNVLGPQKSDWFFLDSSTKVQSTTESCSSKYHKYFVDENKFAAFQSTASKLLLECFTFTSTHLPTTSYKQAISGKVFALDAHRSALFIKHLGRGSFGAADLFTIANSNGETAPIVMKSSKVEYSLQWEVIIQHLIGPSSDKLMVPTELLYFRDTTAALLPFGTLGTLLNLLKTFSSIGLSEGEREISICFLLLQIIKEISILHESNVAHLDIKLDNWILTEDVRHGHPCIGIHLIDFGKAQLCCGHRNDKEEVQLSNIYHSALTDELKTVPIVFTHAATVSNTAFCTGSGIQMDMIAIACCLHQLLFYRDLDIVRDVDGRQRPRETMKRYWRVEWFSIFEYLLNWEPVLFDSSSYKYLTVILSSFLETSCESSTINLRLIAGLKLH